MGKQQRIISQYFSKLSGGKKTNSFKEKTPLKQDGKSSASRSRPSQHRSQKKRKKKEHAEKESVEPTAKKFRLESSSNTGIEDLQMFEAASSVRKPNASKPKASKLNASKSVKLNQNLPIKEKKSPLQKMVIDEDNIEIDDIFEQAKVSDPKRHEHLVKKHGVASATVIDEMTDKKVSAKRGKGKLTALEKQWMELKSRYSDVMLAVEVGYKYKFFDKDADVAANLLDFYVNYKRQHEGGLRTCSFPTHRLNVHMARLVAAGQKVGVVTQTETAAIKKHSKSTGLFKRDVTKMYTSATMIDAVESTKITRGKVASRFILCIMEKPQSMWVGGVKDAERVTISMVAVDPTGGEVVWDVFQDDYVRGNLEARLLSLKPVEILIPGSKDMDGVRVGKSEDAPAPAKLSTFTAKLLSHYCATQDHNVRIEVLSTKKYIFNDSHARMNLEKFYEEALNNCKSEDDSEIFSFLSNNFTKASKTEVARSSLQSAFICLSALSTYLQEFKLEAVLGSPAQFHRFSDSAPLLMDAVTLRRLEVFLNEDGKREGSLFWHLSHCRTQFGTRCLRRWISHPLCSKSAIDERLDAVNELVTSELDWIEKCNELLTKLPDLESQILRIQYRRCTPMEFWNVLYAFRRVVQTFSDMEQSERPESKLLRQIDSALSNPELSETLASFSQRLDPNSVEKGNLANVYKDDPEVLGKLKRSIRSVEEDLREKLKKIRRLLDIPWLEYKCILKTSHLIEVPKLKAKSVPHDWLKINATKKFVRFHPPEVVESMEELQRLQEELEASAKECWNNFLGEFNDCYVVFRGAISNLAVLDCLFSLRHVADFAGYSRPKIIDSERPCLVVKQGRHPMAEAILSSQYVPNNIDVRKDTARCHIITGPNMGGKSSYQRSMALIVIMAQLGSFVPAEEATVGIFDGIFTRMGADDSITKGMSTFQTELAEAALILKNASSRSLVLMDELGRGTSTHDGMAIAFAAVEYIANKLDCLCLFTTHFLPLTKLAETYPTKIQNKFMSFHIKSENENKKKSQKQVVFLYKIQPGICPESYGLNVARLADIPEKIIDRAEEKGDALRKIVEDRKQKANKAS